METILLKKVQIYAFNLFLFWYKEKKKKHFAIPLYVLHVKNKQENCYTSRDQLQTDWSSPANKYLNKIALVNGYLISRLCKKDLKTVIYVLSSVIGTAEIGEKKFIILSIISLQNYWRWRILHCSILISWMCCNRAVKLFVQLWRIHMCENTALECSYNAIRVKN